MEEVIKKIIQIEENAQKIIDDALEEKRQKEEEHKKRISELEEKTISSARQKVDQIRSREFKEIQKEEDEKIERCNERLKELDEIAKGKMDSWVEELYQRVIS